MHTLYPSYIESTPSTDKTERLRTIPAWSRAEPLEKLAEAYVCIERRGGQVFTLRLREDVRRRAIASAETPIRFLSRRIQKAFHRYSLPIPLHAFCLEVTRDDRNELHLHGAIVLGDLPLCQVKDALRDAGGRIEGKPGSRQIEIKKFDFDRGGPVGWADYTRKALTRTRRVIQHNQVTYIHSRLRWLCEGQWELHRGQRNGRSYSLEGSMLG